MKENKSPFLDMANAISALRLELPESVWKDVAAKWANVVNTINTPTPEVGKEALNKIASDYLKVMKETDTPEVNISEIENLYDAFCNWYEDDGSQDAFLRSEAMAAIDKYTALQCEAKDAEIKELREALAGMMQEYKYSVEDYCKNNNTTWDALYKMGLPSFQKAEQAINKTQ